MHSAAEPAVHGRDEPRYRVHLAVRYGARDDELSREYAENLSRGGLYLRGADHLEPGDVVDIEVDLPGSYRHQVTARVAYVLSGTDAAAFGRRPGAGLQIIDGTPGFADALGYFLHRLERRGDFSVLATDPECVRLLREAGYRAAPAPPPHALVAAVEQSDVPVIGVVVTRSQRDAYVEAARAGGDPGLIHAVDYIEELDESLARFDLGF